MNAFSRLEHQVMKEKELEVVAKGKSDHYLSFQWILLSQLHLCSHFHLRQQCWFDWTQIQDYQRTTIIHSCTHCCVKACKTGMPQRGENLSCQ